MKVVAVLWVLPLLACCTNDTTTRSDKPLSRAVALGQLHRALPASAHDIYFLCFTGGMQSFEQYVRFDVDPGELDAAIDALVAENNRMIKRSLEYPRLSLEKSPHVDARKEFLPMPWWNPSVVTKGYYRGENTVWALQIIADTEHSRVYVREMD